MYQTGELPKSSVVKQGAMSKQKVIYFIFTKLSDIITNSKLRHRRILCLRFQGFVLFFPLSFLPSFADVHCLWGFTSSRSWTMDMWWGIFSKISQISISKYGQMGQKYCRLFGVTPVEISAHILLLCKVFEIVTR